MSKTKYAIIESFTGYQNKRDITKLPPGVLIEGSQNVYINDADRVAHMPGYTVDGAVEADVDLGVQGSFDWLTNTNVERNVKSFDDLLTVRVVDGDNVSWETIADSFTSVKFQFAPWWDESEKMDILLFVNGDSNIYSWTGGIAKVDITSSTSNTIRLLDSASNWFEKRFSASATYDKKLTIGGIEYTYTGGEGTNTLTGVSPDPTLGGHSDGDWGIQTVTTHANSPASDASEFSNDLISVLYNQAWIGSLRNNAVYVSSQSDFTDFSLTSPRQIGDPAFFYLDGSLRAFAPAEEVMNISAGESLWYTARAELSADLQSEELVVTLLKSGAQQGAISQDATFLVKNAVAFISNEPVLDTLGKIENITTEQTKGISDPIKKDFDRYNFTRSHGKFFRNQLFITLPTESGLLIYDVERGYWQAPWVVPAGRLAIIGGELYMHSNVSGTTYKLFSGRNAAGNSIAARAVFSYINNADRVNRKKFNERYTEGFISTNTNLVRYDIIDWRGIEGSITQEILGNDETIVLTPSQGNPLGSHPLGLMPLGTTGEEDEEKNRFRVIAGNPPTDYREILVSFESDGTDYFWEVTAFGHDTASSSNNNSDITT